MKNFFKLISLIIILLFGIIINPILWAISLFKTNEKLEYYHNLRKFVRNDNECNEFWKESFSSESEFIRFEKEIKGKFKLVGQTISYSPKPKVKFLFYEYGAENWEGGYIFECVKSNTLWELSHPDNAYRGYFKSINLNKNTIYKYLEK